MFGSNKRAYPLSMFLNQVYGYPVYQHSVINISHDMESLLLGLYTVLTLSRHALET